MRSIICSDCGITVVPACSTTTRCKDCQRKHKAAYLREYAKTYVTDYKPFRVYVKRGANEQA